MQNKVNSKWKKRGKQPPKRANKIKQVNYSRKIFESPFYYIVFLWFQTLTSSNNFKTF